MGWKRLKEHYRIVHRIQVSEGRICIGSDLCHNLIVLSMDGEILKERDWTTNEDLQRYITEFKTDRDTLRRVISEPDVFEQSIPVYTYSGGEIVLKQCEKLGWPNLTHDGDLMYANTYSQDIRFIVTIAKRNALAGIESTKGHIEETRTRLATQEGYLAEYQRDIAMLNEKYPDVQVTLD